MRAGMIGHLAASMIIVCNRPDEKEYSATFRCVYIYCADDNLRHPCVIVWNTEIEYEDMFRCSGLENATEFLESLARTFRS